MSAPEEPKTSFPTAGAAERPESTECPAPLGTRLVRWAGKNPQLVLQLVSVVIVGALVGVPLQILNARETRQAALTRRASEERTLLQDAREALSADASHVWAWPLLKGFVHRHRDLVKALAIVGPKAGDTGLSPEFERGALALGELWYAELGEPAPPAFEYCAAVERQLLTLERAIAEDRLRVEILEPHLGGEIAKFADDVAPRCALVLARTSGDRAAFLAVYMFPVAGRELSDDPYRAVRPQWVSLKTFRPRFRSHPDNRPALRSLDLPLSAFARCGGYISAHALQAVPAYQAGEVEFRFSPIWPSSGPGERTPCLLLGASETGFSLTNGHFEARNVPRFGADWLAIEFSAQGDVRATLFVAKHGIPISAQVQARRFDWRAPQVIRATWDVESLVPEEALTLSVGDASAYGSMEARPKHGLSDSRATAYSGSGGSRERVGFRCDVRVGQSVVDQLRRAGASIPPCFLRQNGTARKYGRCRIPAIRERRFAETWVFAEAIPPGMEILSDTCDVVGSGAWEHEPIRCRMRPQGGRDCLRREPSGVLVDPGDAVSFPASEAVGTGCVPFPCVVLAGDTPEPED